MSGSKLKRSGHLSNETPSNESAPDCMPPKPELGPPKPELELKKDDESMPLQQHHHTSIENSEAWIERAKIRQIEAKRLT